MCPACFTTAVIIVASAGSGGGAAAFLRTVADIPTPKGRNETGPGFNLGDWVRHHDRYEADGCVDAGGRYHQKEEKSECRCAKEAKA